MIERHEWTTHKDHGNAGPQEEQYGKFYHGTTSQGQKFKRSGTEKVSVTSLIKETLLLYLFTYLLTYLLYLIILIMKTWVQLIRLIWVQN